MKTAEKGVEPSTRRAQGHKTREFTDITLLLGTYSRDLDRHGNTRIGVEPHTGVFRGQGVSVSVRLKSFCTIRLAL